MTEKKILLSILMILLSTLNVIRYLICGNNQNCLLNFSLIYKTLWTGAGCGMFISLLEKTQLVSFDCFNNIGAIGVKMDGSVLVENSSLKMLGLAFSSKLDLGSYIISIAKTLQENWSLDSFYEVSFS